MTDAITIDELLALLRAVKPVTSVYLVFPGYAVPTKVDSYRGYYDRPALGFALGGYVGTGPAEAPKASDLITELEAATDGRHFEGWKGGFFTYKRSMPLFVDGRGDASSILVTGLFDEEYRATILTAYLPGAY